MGARAAGVGLAGTLVGADVAFYAVFAVFVVALVVLVVITIRWAVRRDRVGRAEWARRHQERPGEPDPDGAPGRDPPDATGRWDRPPGGPR